MGMTEENRNTSNAWNSKTLVIAAAAVVLVIVFMYLYDQKQQQAYELRRLEKRVELLEDWGRPRQNMQVPPPPPQTAPETMVVEICNAPGFCETKSGEWFKRCRSFEWPSVGMAAKG